MYGTPAAPNVCSDAVLLHRFVQNVELILSQLHAWYNILCMESSPAFQENNIVRMSEFVEHKSLCASSTSMLPTFAIHGQSGYLYQVKHIRFTATCVG